MTVETAKPLVGLLEIGIKLEAAQRFDKAYEAYLRIINHEGTPPNLRATAEKAIARIKPLLPVIEKTPKAKEIPPNKEEDKVLEGLVMVEINTLEVIPEIENLVPITDDDYNRMKEDIEERGVLFPLIATKDFGVICGYNRLKIARELGIKTLPVIFKDIDEKDKISYAIKDNLNRRQLTPDIRAELIVKLTEHVKPGRRKKKDKSPTTEEVAKDLGLSRRSVARARAFVKQIKEKPELQGRSIRSVLTGEPEGRYTRKFEYTLGADDHNLEENVMDAVGEIMDMDMREGDQLVVLVQAWVRARK